MKLLSLDASTKSTGWCVFEDNKIIKYGNIIDDDDNVMKRIKRMAQEIANIAKKYNVGKVIYEDVVPDDVHSNQKVFKALMYLQGAVALLLDNQGLRLNLVVASHWRSLCGIKTGRYVKRKELKEASKKKVKENFGIDVNDDVADAICIGVSYFIEQNKKKSKITVVDGFEFE